MARSSIEKEMCIQVFMKYFPHDGSDDPEEQENLTAALCSYLSGLEKNSTTKAESGGSRAFFLQSEEKSSTLRI